ncbi:AraC family transcriptional regulator [Parasphingorhabdus litoris]|uniref:AraC family transcriptional regulator n=1 Tax=Parasphingorhabdus litoris TaxID=394733 RepID=A0ABN1A9J8_9SPHN|nr:helix-turn-helix transcriptional regulator [Parasphingorhabdus litoris]
MGDPANIDIGWRSALMLAAALPVYASMIFLLVRNVERRASLFLAATLFAIAFTLTPQIIGYAGFYDVWPGLTFFPFNTKLWIAPLFYLHAYCLMHGGPLGWRKYLLLPGLIQTVYYIWAFTALGDYKTKWAYNAAFHEPYVVRFETFLAIMLTILTAIAVVRLMRRYRTYLQTTQSAASDFDPRWISRLFIVASVAIFLWMLIEIVDVAIVPLSYNQEYPFQLTIMLIVAGAGLDALSSIREPFPKISNALGAFSRESEQRDWAAEGNALERKVRQEQWYLEPRLNIRDVASRQASNESYISRSLNQGLGLTFNAFINGLRVDHAKDLLGRTDENLIQVAFASGFNSKASFNRVFKEMAGMTPTDYRRNPAN